MDVISLVLKVIGGMFKLITAKFAIQLVQPVLARIQPSVKNVHRFMEIMH